MRRAAEAYHAAYQGTKYCFASRQPLFVTRFASRASDLFSRLESPFTGSLTFACFFARFADRGRERRLQERRSLLRIRF